MASDELNYYVDLRADFKYPESVDESCGVELAEILAQKLPTRNIAVVNVESDDFGYCLECISGSSTIELVISPDLSDENRDRWYVCPLAKRSFSGRREHSVADCRTLLLAVNTALHECQRISDIRWFPYFDAQEYLALMPVSSGPIRDPDFEQNLHPLIRLDWRLSRISSAVASPLSCILGFGVMVVLALLFPDFVGHIALAIFVLMAVLLMIAPLVLSILIRRESRRRST